MALKETIIRELRNAIVRGEYKTGERLKEPDLCRRYKVSRAPVREALNQLQAEGFVTMTPNRGARVVEFSADDVSNIYDVLISLESAASRLACANITNEQILKLEEYQFMMERAFEGMNGDFFFELNVQFHMFITEITNNPYLIDIRSNFRGFIDRFARFSPFIPEQLKATLEEHPRIIEGLKSRNPAMAEFAAREHLENAKQLMLNYFMELEG